jgi:hypothetical protein
MLFSLSKKPGSHDDKLEGIVEFSSTVIKLGAVGAKSERLASWLRSGDVGVWGDVIERGSITPSSRLCRTGEVQVSHDGRF